MRHGTTDPPASGKSDASGAPDIRLPESLLCKVSSYRRRLWTLKIWEAAALAVIGVLVGFFAVFVLDRFGDTPVWIRAITLAVAAVFVAVIPYAIERWVIRRRHLHQVAELLAKTEPAVGDRLLGVVELSGSASEQSRSPVLVQAAIDQVAQDIVARDLRHAIPRPRHVRRSIVAAALIAGVGCLFGISAAATSNAWGRFLRPLSDVPRYTFTQVDPLPAEMVVAHGEPFDFEVKLAEATESQPSVASANFGGVRTNAAREADGYRFNLPGQYRQDDLEFSAGDYHGSTKLIPTTRPELSDIEATIHLPDYLQRPEPVLRNVRSGSLSVVRGSRVELDVTVSRGLNSATVDGRPAEVDGDHFSPPPHLVDGPHRLTMTWQDVLKLAPGRPFELALVDINDAAPTIAADGLPKRKVLLETEVLSFRAFARDDYGIKRVGLVWEQVDDGGDLVPGGEKLIAVGRPDADMLELAGTFSAKDLDRQSPTLAVRLFVEDFLPDRERVYGPISVFDVLTADEHAIWIANQLARWHRQALDVRDRELKLFENNKELRQMSARELNTPETRDRLKAQARGEQANGRRLTGLVDSGESLLTEAMRNPEIGVGHLEEWAEMMQTLQDISGNRMPSVADLLKEASQSESLARSKDATEQLSAGQNRLKRQGESNSETEGDPKPPAPTLTDIESSQHDLSEQKEGPPSKKKPSQAKLTIPTTRLAGNGKAEEEPAEPKENEVDEAVIEQEDLLDEFEKVAGKLNELLANMEGSTLVKRLKAASRKQEQVATTLASVTTSTFGLPGGIDEQATGVLTGLSDKVKTYETEVSYIMDDMDAYFERSRFAQFKLVLDDMRNEDVTTALANLSTDIPEETGLSMAMAEYWCETMDRWAEDLVEPSMCGSCPGGANNRSLPPSVVLEVLQVLEAEIKLRETTRETQQARPGLEELRFDEIAGKLSSDQDLLRDRIDAVNLRISELPEAEQHFAKEMKKLAAVSAVMVEAVEILARPETGTPAIGAETEAIELLLETKRMCQGGGGGGGANPGGGGGGDTEAPALALVGQGINAQEIREDMRAETTSGKAGVSLPEEFRAGLDRYFHQIQQWQDEQ